MSSILFPRVQCLYDLVIVSPLARITFFNLFGREVMVFSMTVPSTSSQHFSIILFSAQIEDCGFSYTRVERTYQIFSIGFKSGNCGTSHPSTQVCGHAAKPWWNGINASDHDLPETPNLWSQVNKDTQLVFIDISMARGFW